MVRGRGGRVRGSGEGGSREGLWTALTNKETGKIILQRVILSWQASNLPYRTAFSSKVHREKVRRRGTEWCNNKYTSDLTFRLSCIRDTPLYGLGKVLCYLYYTCYLFQWLICKIHGLYFETLHWKGCCWSLAFKGDFFSFFLSFFFPVLVTD